VALLVAKHSVGLKRRRISSKILFWELRKNFVASPYFLKRHTLFELRTGVTQITLPNNKCVQSTLEGKHTIKIKQCIVSPKEYLSPYSDFKMSLIWTSLSRVRNTKRKSYCHSREKENKIINEKCAWNEKHYFSRQYTNHIIITRCLTSNGYCVWFLLINNSCNTASSVTSCCRKHLRIRVQW
jgi:hypothetical protein